MLAVRDMSWRRGSQRLFVVITDAPVHTLSDGSGLSDYDMPETIAAVRALGGSVFAVGPDVAKGGALGNDGKPVTAKVYGATDDIKTLALDTGGLWQNIETANFSAFVDEIVDIITSLYTVTYTTSNPARDGLWREVIVTVNDPAATLPGGKTAGTGLTDCDEGTYQAPEADVDCDQTEGDFVHVMAVGYATAALFPEITATVRVNSDAGRACELGKPNFAAAEDGVWQTITSVTCAGTSGSVADIAIVFDDTFSMNDEIDVMKAKATQFVNDIVAGGVDARFALISFKDNETVRQDFTSAVGTFQTAIDALVADGGDDAPETSLDAVMLALSLGWRTGAQKLIIVITDNSSHYLNDGTSFSTNTMDGVIAAVNGAGAAVFAVAPTATKAGALDNAGKPAAAKVALTHENDIRVLADSTGGFWQPIGTAADFGTFIDRIVEVVTSLYTVVYTASNNALDGTWRDVVIRVTDPQEGTDCDDGTYRAPLAPATCENGQGNDFLSVMAVGYAEAGIFPQITATVRVDSEAGRACELSKPDFALTEDGVVQTITSVTCAGTGGSVADIVICFDDTFSMNDEIGMMQTKATQFVNDIAAAGVDARFALISFKDTETIRQGFTANVATFQTAINSLVAAGGDDAPETSLDAVMLALTLGWRPGAQKLIVVITDNSSHYLDDGTAFSTNTMDGVIAAVNGAGASVFAVAPTVTKAGGLDNAGKPGAAKVALTHENDIRVLADSTGGFWQPIGTAADFGAFIDRIVEVITSLYTVTYTTSHWALDGTWREVIVSVTDPVEGTDCDDGMYQAPLECLELVVEPTSISTTCMAGTSPANAVFRVTNGCTGTLNYTVSESVGWLSVSPASGTATGTDGDDITVTFSAASLLAGDYVGEITVSGGGASQIVTVYLTVLDLYVQRHFPPECHEPGDSIEVSVTIAYGGVGTVTSLAVYETMPASWTFAGLVGGVSDPSVRLPLGPADPIEFFWLDMPSLPYVLKYLVRAPALKTETEDGSYGWYCFEGDTKYRTDGDEMAVPTLGEQCVELRDCSIVSCDPHQADQNGDWTIQLAEDPLGRWTGELTRMIQFYNRRGYHCQDGTEDGYAPVVGDTTCGPHQADRNGDWVIQLSPDLTRMIQFYNSGGYHCQVGTEDGYAPGLLPLLKAGGEKGTVTSVRSFSSALYQAGTTLDISVRISASAPGNLASLAVQETLPPGWTFQSVVSTPLPPIRPTLPGATGTLGFGWVTVPSAWPVTLTYRVNVPAGTIGTKSFSGQVFYREDAGETPVTTPTSTIGGNEVTITFVAGEHGTLLGTLVQTVPVGETTTAVTAVALPATEYRFAEWLRGGTVFSTANPLTVTATVNMTLTAQFVPNRHTVTFLAGALGTISGTATQEVLHGGSTTPVTAVARYGNVFTQWSDGSTANPRTLTNVTADQTLTASFQAATVVAPNGSFLAVVGATEVAAGRGLWDLTGTYSTTVGSNPLTLAVVADSRGRLTGQATLQVTTAKASVPVAMPIKGTVRGASGTILVTMAMQGAVPASGVSASLTYNLTLNRTTRQLSGRVTGSVKAGATTPPVGADVTLALPSGMDGTWTFLFQVSPDGRTVSGTATLALSSGTSYLFTLKGRIVGQTVVAKLAGDPSDPAAQAIKATATFTPLQGGWARLDAFTLTSHGQSLRW
jgi:VWFA-related protein